MGYDELIQDALATPFEGWDFAVFDGRMTTAGDSLAPLSPRTVATEGHPPNVPVARRRLEALGVEVVAAGGEGALPLPTGAFDLIVNRHEAYDPHEVRRLLAPGGTFVTQQVEGRDLEELNAALGGPPHEDAHWNLDAAAGCAPCTTTWRAAARYGRPRAGSRWSPAARAERRIAGVGGVSRSRPGAARPASRCSGSSCG
ncbi:hypothetical protein ABGB14_03095 [Nonomuraea sp. B10E15]|uniref:hypothetical protein n=1 Tax=Nonomuraea sp. B10E15 TaxID=3153560 RepID=UPI00325EAA54